MRKLSFEIRLICNRRRLPVFSLRNSWKTFSVKETLFPLSHSVPGTFPFGADSRVGRRCGDFFAAFKVVAEELEDLALKGLAQLRYAERENNGRTFLESAGSHGEHDERVEAVIVWPRRDGRRLSISER